MNNLLFHFLQVCEYCYFVKLGDSSANLLARPCKRSNLRWELTPVAENECPSASIAWCSLACSQDFMALAYVWEKVVSRSCDQTISWILLKVVRGFKLPCDGTVIYIITAIKYQMISNSFENTRAVSTGSVETAHFGITELLSTWRTVQHTTETAMVKVMDDILCKSHGRHTMLHQRQFRLHVGQSRHLGRIWHDESQHSTSPTQTRFWNKWTCTTVVGFLSIRCASRYTVTSTGVPQESILGLLHFISYMAPISRLIESYGSTYYKYADDTQLCIPCSTTWFESTQHGQLHRRILVLE